MNDFQLLRFFDHFSNEIFRGLHNSLSEILATMPSDLQTTPELLAIRQLKPELAAEAMPREEAVAIARNLLQSWATDDTLAPLLEKAQAQYRDTEQSAMVILAIGAAVSMVLLSAGQSRFEVEAFGLKINFGGRTDKNDKDFSRTLHAMPATTQKLLQQRKPSPIIDLLCENKLPEALQLLENQAPAHLLQDVYLLKARYSNWVITSEEGRFLSAEAQLGAQNQIFAAIIDLSLQLT